MNLLTKLMIAGGAISAPARTYPASFNILLSSPVGATIADGTGVVTINNSPITANVTTNRTADSNTGVAPFAVQFDATGTTSVGVALPFRDLYHSWNFGDNDTVTWGFGTQAGVSKKNRDTGGIAAHVFETPGVYAVSYMVINPLTGAMASKSITVTVLDPDVVFAANTVYVSTGTITAGAGGIPSGANVQSNVTTVSGILSLASTYKRILLKRGDSWSVGASTGFAVAGPGIVGAFGTGAAPKFSITAASVSVINSYNGGCQDWRFMDMESEATGLATGSARKGTSFFTAIGGGGIGNTSGKHCLFLRINHHHAGTFVSLGNDSVVADCNADNIDGGGGNVGIWCYQRERIAILGTSVNDASLAEMNVRLQGVKKGIVKHCYLKDPIANGLKHALAIRGWSESNVWTGDYTEYVIASDNVITGRSSSGLVQFGSQNALSDERHRYIICERNYIKADYTSYGACFNASTSYSAIRNNLFEGLNGIEYAAILGNSPATASNGNAVLPPVDVTFHNNSFYNPSTVPHAGTMLAVVSAAATGIDVKNNVAYLPNYSGLKSILTYSVGSVCTASNNTPDANIGSVSPSFTTTPPLTYADWKPTTGYTINAGAIVPVYDDFFGLQRIGTFDMGAVQP